MSTLSDTDFAKAGLDLTSWVLEDDLYHQNFHYGAKETQSISAGGLESGPGLQADLGCQDVLMETGDLSWTDVCQLDKYFPNVKKEDLLPAPNVLVDDIFSSDMELEHLMKQEIVQQQKLDQLQFYKQKEEEELLKKQRDQELLYQQQKQELLRSFEQQAANESFMQQQQQPLVHDSRGQEPEVQEILYHDVLSPTQYLNSSSSSPSYSVSSFDAISPSSDSYGSNSGGPYIISVPVSEALVKDAKPQSAIPHFVIKYPSKESLDDDAVLEMGSKHPERLVINVKKVTLGNKSSVSSKACASPELPPCASTPTLKEALEGNEADEFMREMLDSPRVYGSSVDSGEEECYYEQFSPASQSSSLFSDMPASPRIVKAKGCRGNPYSITEKKLRKKEQNKRAALRYRHKKKEEEGGILSVLKKEEELQKKLLEKYETVRTELKLMKKLAREMLVAQGKLKQ